MLLKTGQQIVESSTIFVVRSTIGDEKTADIIENIPINNKAELAQRHPNQVGTLLEEKQNSKE